MTKYPILNALSALAYISFVAVLLHFAQKLGIEDNSLLIPIMMLTLFVVSAAITSFLVCLEPIKLFADGKREESIYVFLTTIVYLAVACAILFATLVLIS